MSDDTTQEFQGDEACGARAIGGPCVLRRAHNMGQLDIPSAHQASRKTSNLSAGRHLNAQDVADAVGRLKDYVATCETTGRPTPGTGVATDLRTVVEAALQRDFYYRAAFTIEDEIQSTLAKALGYPEYEPGEPGYSPDGPSYVIGDHVAGSLALEAANAIAAVTAERDALAARLAAATSILAKKVEQSPRGLFNNLTGRAAHDATKVAKAHRALTDPAELD